jgi:HPt (histidine-containing phosphotransfer) domain-containing protein
MCNASSANAPLDEAALLNSVGVDAEFLRELVELFLAACPTLLCQIQASLSINDFPAIRRSARTLMSSLRYFAVEHTQNAVAPFDKAAHRGQQAATAETFRVLEEKIRALTSALSELNTLLVLREKNVAQWSGALLHP